MDKWSKSFINTISHYQPSVYEINWGEFSYNTYNGATRLFNHFFIVFIFKMNLEMTKVTILLKKGKTERVGFSKKKECLRIHI